MSPGGALSDFRPREIAASAIAALAVMTAAGVALRAARFDRPPAPVIDPSVERAVRVVAVTDTDVPLLALGGKRDPRTLPDRRVEEQPSQRIERKAFVSPKAGKAEADIPPPEVAIADAGTEPPPPDASVALRVDTPIEPSDAGAVANVDRPGSSDGVNGGTETDPLKARAVDLYRGRIASWFSRRFRVSGSGLSQADLVRYRVSATVDVGPDRAVTGYSLVPSGNASFDAAARAALEGAKGQSIPPPPENYPDVVQRRINVTFVCKENRCD